MTVSKSFTEGVVDMLAPLGTIAQRRMFGSIALYCDGQVFAILFQDVIYFKVDDQTRPAFDAEFCGPFKYPLKDGSMQVLASYHRAPDRLLDDPDEICLWARTAIAAARRSAVKRPEAQTRSAHRQRRKPAARTGPARRGDRSSS